MEHTGPLTGVRVIDLTAMVMGPYCTQIMADMGADVIKIEPPAGDNTRYISVGPEPGMAGVFVNVNRGKRSVVLDLRTEDGKATLRRLVEDADVFIHSMRGKAIAKLGFGYDEVVAINPSIVYTNCYGYGRRRASGSARRESRQAGSGSHARGVPDDLAVRLGRTSGGAVRAPHSAEASRHAGRRDSIRLQRSGRDWLHPSVGGRRQREDCASLQRALTLRPPRAGRC